MADTESFHRDLNAALAIVFQDAEDRFQLDRHGMVTIAFGNMGDVVLQALPDQETVLLSAEVCPIGREDTALLRRALETNLFRLSPPGAFVAYDPDRGVLVLCQSTGPRMAQADGLADCLSEFVAAIATARAAILAPSVEANRQADYAMGVSDIIISG